MKRLFTLALVMAMTITGFAQVKSISHKSVKAEPAQAITVTGLEDMQANFPASTRNIMTAPEEFELSQTYYDWQSNMGARNYTTVWPDGFAVMCYTQSTETTYSDRGTGLAWFDPAVGEWQFTDARVEGVKTGFGCVARYGERGLVVAAHGSTDCRIFIKEDFRDDPTGSFGEGIILPVESGVDPVWPVVQCSGENLDIIHILVTNSGASIGSYGADPIVYYRYENGEWTAQYETLEALDESNLTDGGSNVTYFMLYNPEKPNRVSFILNNAWSDGKLVISEDNGATWSERVFYQHPGITTTYEDWFFYPRWTNAAFDDDDVLHVAYEYNGTTGEPGSGSYYPAIGGVAYWRENLPLNDICLGGIENGDGFIMDSTYLMQDIYQSEWYWSDALHEPLSEYIGELEIVDAEGNVLPRDATEGYWPNNELWGSHGSYNGGKAAFATMHVDGNRVFVFWSMIAGDSETMYFDGTNHYLRLFCNMSEDGGNTWLGTKQLITDIMDLYDEMVYCQVIPYVYYDEEGAYLWLCYMNDQEPGTYVQDDETVYDNNFYRAVKVYVSYIGGDNVGENTLTVAPTVNVFPNPAEGSFTISMNNASDVNIFNTVGQLVKTYKNVKDMNVNLESGVYFVNANNQTVKVIVK